MKESASKAKSILKTILKASVSIGGLAYIFSKIPFQEVSKHWTSEALPWIGVVLVTTFLSMCVQANRWKGLLLDNAKGIKLRTFYAYIALGYFFNNLLPSGFGGDAVKTIAFGKRFGNMANSVAAIVISRIMRSRSSPAAMKSLPYTPAPSAFSPLHPSSSLSAGSSSTRSAYRKNYPAATPSWKSFRTPSAFTVPTRKLSSCLLSIPSGCRFSR